VNSEYVNDGGRQLILVVSICVMEPGMVFKNEFILSFWNSLSRLELRSSLQDIVGLLHICLWFCIAESFLRPQGMYRILTSVNKTFAYCTCYVRCVYYSD
jgi:hypothetical protein